MRQFFVDTNVVIGFLADRKPFATQAAQLFDLQTRKRVKLYLTAVSYNNIYHIVRKHVKHSSTIEIMKQLETMTETIETNAEVIRAALDSNFKDFEDAVQYHSALAVKKIDAIVTRNGRDFKYSKISILTPEEALTLVKGNNL